MFNSIFPKIHKEGYKFLAISILITFLVLLFSKFLGLILVVITIWVYYFFRDPERYPINDDTFLVSPADGLITDVSEKTGPIELQLENTTYTKISIFMNVFNCHVNRIPISGTIEEINYYKIESNESGEEIIIVQIAGLIARRIVCEVEQEQNLRQGERIGMIRFGSRVDIYFKNKKILAQIGQNVVAGESLIASE
mgnify:CR=1 FL=1